MDGGLENKWLMDFGCSRHMTGNKKWFSSLTPLSHKEYVTFEDDKKGKVLSTEIIKVNDYFTLNDVALVDYHTWFLHQNQVLIICMTQDQLFTHTAKRVHR
jgi:hypothetical protein